jgi:bacteriocin-like protein
MGFTQKGVVEELSEEQLSQVVGGLQPQPLPPDHDGLRHRMQ